MMTSLPLGRGPRGVFQEGRLGWWAFACIGLALRSGLHLGLVAPVPRGHSPVTEVFPACFPPCGQVHALGLDGSVLSSQVLAGPTVQAGHTRRTPE